MEHNAVTSGLASPSLKPTDALCDELMELERELAKAPATDSFAELDALLEESMQLREERGSGKSLRERLAKAQDKEEAAEIEFQLREWESKYEWETLANVALFQKQICRCGSNHIHFVGMYYHQKHRTDKHAQRWIQSWDSHSANAQELQNKTCMEIRYIPLCADCAADSMFDLTQAEEPWK